MAIAKMTKIMIASHHSEAKDLLETLQQAGIVEILNAEKAMVSKEWPELQVEIKRPKDLEDAVSRIGKCIAFLKEHAIDKDPASLFQPLVEIEKGKYTEIVSGKEALNLLEEAEQTQAEIEKFNTKYENSSGTFEALLPWKSLETPVEQIKELQRTTCLGGMIPHQHFNEIAEKLRELDAVIQQIGSTGNMHACLVVCMNEVVVDVQKALRSGDFEAVSFEGMNGTVAELLEECEEKLAKIGLELGQAKQKAVELSKNRLDVQILFDHYQNLLTREQTMVSSPATEHVILLEGWIKRKDLKRLEKIIGESSASTVNKILPGEGEEIPVEIENNAAIRPFETVTRLYGMPASTDVDPTVFFAPFFAIFFGLCMTDAAYGLVMIAFMWWLIKKIKGEKKFMWMMVVCSITTVIAGALTGGWFGDAIQSFFGADSAINKFRTSLMWFDPLEKPMYFFYISLALGYTQILFGIAISFVHKLKARDYTSAVFDHLSWLIWLNSLLIFGLAKVGMLPEAIGTLFIIIALVPAVMILLFSEREGGWGGRVGMGFYNLFSTVFYVGDVLSYIRLMALGMVTGGFGMAINEICKSITASEKTPLMTVIAYIGAGIVFVGMHTFNIANSALGSFVHTMRLQFVEFFTKFIIGGGKDFKPLQKKYTHISVEE